MKVIACNGSAGKDGNTAILLQAMKILGQNMAWLLKKTNA